MSIVAAFIHTVHLNSALNGGSEILLFEHSDVMEWCSFSAHALAYAHPTMPWFNNSGLTSYASHTLNRSWEISHFTCSGVIKIHNQGFIQDITLGGLGGDLLGIISILCV